MYNMSVLIVTLHEEIIGFSYLVTGKIKIAIVILGGHVKKKKNDIVKIIFKDVSREFDEFQVNTHLCKLRCWYS